MLKYNVHSLSVQSILKYNVHSLSVQLNTQTYCTQFISTIQYLNIMYKDYLYSSILKYNVH